MTDGISNFIERLRGYVRNMTEENQEKSMKYLELFFELFENIIINSIYYLNLFILIYLK